MKKELKSDFDKVNVKSKKIEDALMNLLSTSSLSTNQFVTFKIANEEYGLDIKSVQEITAYKQLTHVPNVHKFVKGIYNLRGNIIPVIDPRIKFGMNSKEYNNFSIIIIFRTTGKTLGMIVDEVSDVLSIEEEEIQDMPEFSTSINTQFIKGIGKVQDKLIIILDIDKICSEEELKNLSPA